MAVVAGVACNSTSAIGLSVQTREKVRGTVVPISVGFLGQFAATLAAGPARKLLVCRVSYDRMALLTFTAWLTRRFRFTLDRRNFASELSPPWPERRRRPAAEAHHTSEDGR
jgi:hypothetical protein